MYTRGSITYTCIYPVASVTSVHNMCVNTLYYVLNACIMCVMCYVIHVGEIPCLSSSVI